MGTPAWQVRESQRQNLITRLMSVIYGVEDIAEDPHFLFEVIASLMVYLQEPRKEQALCGGVSEYVQFFVFEQLIEQIEKFARSDKEYLVCVARLAEIVLDAATSHMRAGLQSEEMHEPAKIFSADSAMTEVPLEEYLIDDPKR